MCEPPFILNRGGTVSDSNIPSCQDVFPLFKWSNLMISIHPLSSAYPGPGCGGSCLSRDTQTSLSPDTSSSSSGRIPRSWRELKRRKLQLMGELLLCLSLWGFNSQKCKSYIWNKTISWKSTRFPTFVCIYCLCKLKDVGSKSSWRELFLQFFHLLSTVAMTSRTVAHAIHTHYKIRRRPKNP